MTGAHEAYRMGVGDDFVFEGVGPTRPEPLPAFANVALAGVVEA